MTRIPVDVGNKSYNYFLTEGYFDKIGEVLRYLVEGRHVLVISQDPVVGLYMDRIVKGLGRVAAKISRLSIPPGEAAKDLNTIEFLANKALELGIDRSSIVIALGGGAVGDAAGFFASVYMRGIDYVHVPTTLLAMVDSSVGGKVAVNVSGGKNIIGAFHQPAAVFADISLLRTLGQEEYSSALAEIIKYGAGFDKDLFHWVDKNLEKIIKRDSHCLLYLVDKCVRLKAAIVREDERDRGQRMLLNLGHTFAHAVEKAGDYSKYSHGQAVGMGLVFSFLLAKRLGRVNGDEVEGIKSLVRRAGLPVKPQGLQFADFWEIIHRDKKWREGMNVFILPEGTGRCSAVYNIDKGLVEQAYKDMMEGL